MKTIMRGNARFLASALILAASATVFAQLDMDTGQAIASSGGYNAPAGDGTTVVSYAASFSIAAVWNGGYLQDAYGAAESFAQSGSLRTKVQSTSIGHVEASGYIQGRLFILTPGEFHIHVAGGATSSTGSDALSSFYSNLPANLSFEAESAFSGPLEYTSWDWTGYLPVRSYDFVLQARSHGTTGVGLAESIAEFSIEPVPEPAPIVGLALGAALLLRRRPDQNLRVTR